MTAAAIVATAQETNAQLLTRCQNKLGSLSPNGPSQAYQFVASSLPVIGSVLPTGAQWTDPTTSYPYAVTSAVTRASTVLNIGSGVIDVYVANGAGPVTGCSQLAIQGVTNASPPVVTCNGHGLSSGAFVIISGTTGVASTITFADGGVIAVTVGAG